MKRFKLGIYPYLFFILFLFSCSNEEEDLIKHKYLLTEWNTHDPVTDDITYSYEYVYDSDDNLILVNSFKTRDINDIDRDYLVYNELNELTLIRQERNGSLHVELHITKENGKISIRGWDNPRVMNYFFNDKNLIFKKEVVYSSNTNIYTYKHNSEGQLVQINAENPSPYTITYDNHITANYNPFLVSSIWIIDVPICIAFDLKFYENGVPTTYVKDELAENFKYEIDNEKNISKMYLDANNVFSFKYK